MTQQRSDFQHVFDQVRAAGYAEAFDVEGIDSTHKLTIVVNLACGTPVNTKDGRDYETRSAGCCLCS